MIHLGRFWNTRIIIIPGGKLVTSGPFRFIPHPIYLTVTVEIFTVPMIFGAWITAILGIIIATIMLLAVRIPAENKALRKLR
jgi:methyltransferase